tara:strand:+ start:4798 stop:5247 length:450 start_codon:yes stop_codon:yes gene_type:complete
MEKTKANNYVISLFETFSIEKNQLLGKEWRNALTNYDEGVVKEGWGQIVAECRTRYLPPLKVVYGLLNNIRLSKQNIVVLEDFTNELTAEDRKNQHRFIRLIQYTMKEMQEKRMTEDEHLKVHAEFFKEIGMDEDADDLLRVVAEHQAV